MNSYHIDYSSVFAQVTANGRTDRLTCIFNEIHYLWIDTYKKATPCPTAICSFEYGDFCFIFDDTDEIALKNPDSEIVCASPRVVAAYGFSSFAPAERNVYRIRSYLGPSANIYGHFGHDYDKGHFIANASGGPLEINLFPQKRALNRGWSDAGKIYRKMERYVAAVPGTLVFSRPFYNDLSLRPARLEFGYLDADDNLQSEIFDNI